MTEKEALEKAVILSPLDDLPRLVMADYLDENGEAERAEFVRVQIEIATLTDDRTRDDCKCPRCRKITGLRRRDSRWTPNELKVGGMVDWSRGFPSSVTLPDLAAYERYGQEIVSRAPVVEVVVSDREPRNMRGSFRWTGARDGHLPREPHHVPFRLIDKMNTPGEYLMGSNRLTRDQAITALARAFADEARHRANLPPVWCGACAGKLLLPS